MQTLVKTTNLHFHYKQIVCHECFMSPLLRSQVSSYLCKVVLQQE